MMTFKLEPKTNISDSANTVINSGVILVIIFIHTFIPTRIHIKTYIISQAGNNLTCLYLYAYFFEIKYQISRIHKTSEETPTIINQSKHPLIFKCQSIVWNIGSTLKKLYNYSTIIIWPNIITPTIVLNPELCGNLK